MSDEKFTPGEWTVHLGIMDPTFVYVGKEDDYVDGETPVICELHHGIKKRHPNTHCMDFDHTEINANAALIAAAPEMYAALVDLVGKSRPGWQEVNVCTETINNALKALKKARGEE